MEVNAQDIIDSVDLTKKDVLLPIYESVVNSIISIGKANNPEKVINVFIERNVSDSPSLTNCSRITWKISNYEVLHNDSEIRN